MPIENAPILSLKYLIRYPIAKSTKSPVLLMLHGYGSNEADLFSLSEDIPPEFLVISVRAPLTLGVGQYAWYPLEWSSGVPVGDRRASEAARLTIKKFIDEVFLTFDIDTAQLFLLGFSQGAIMSFSVALTFPTIAKGVIALSGRVLDETMSIVEKSPTPPLTHFFIGHGIQDQVLPILHARRAKEFLLSQNAPLEYHEYPAPHGITQREESDVHAWIRSLVRTS